MKRHGCQLAFTLSLLMTFVSMAMGQELQMKPAWKGYIDIDTSRAVPDELQVESLTTIERTYIGSEADAPVQYVEQWGEKIDLMGTVARRVSYTGRGCRDSAPPPPYPKFDASVDKPQFSFARYYLDNLPTDKAEAHYRFVIPGNRFAEVNFVYEEPQFTPLEPVIELSRFGAVDSTQGCDVELDQWQDELLVVNDLDDVPEGTQVFLACSVDQWRKDGFLCRAVPERELQVRRELLTGFYNWTLRSWGPPQDVKVFAFSITMIR